MTKFKVGDKVTLVNDFGLCPANLTLGNVYTVNKVSGKFVTLTGEFTEVCRDYRIELYEEKESEMAFTNEMTTEQIRNEIIRINSRIEEAKKDIENAENERNSLVGKLREKGFELFEQRLQKGDKAKIIDNTSSHHFPIGKEVEVSIVYDNYYVCVDTDGATWSCYDNDVEKI